MIGELSRKTLPRPPTPPQWRCSPHQSANVSSMCLRAKRPRGHQVAVFPRYCAPPQDQSCSAADWRPPKSGDQQDDGRLDHPRGQATQRRQMVGFGRGDPKEGTVQASAPLAQLSEATQLHRSAALSDVYRRAHAERRSTYLPCTSKWIKGVGDLRLRKSRPPPFPPPPQDCYATRTLHAHVGFPPHSLPTVCGRNARTCLDLGPVAFRLRNMTNVWPKVWPRTFLSSFGCGCNFLRFR